MKTYVVLFRGINVGGRNILPMIDLVSVLEEKGFESIRSYIQSGNVVFKSKRKPTSEISAAINARFGFSPQLIVMDKAEFLSSVVHNPYQQVEGKCSHCYYCSQFPKLNTAKIESLIAKSEEYAIKGKTFYLHAPDGIGRSKLVANIETCLGVSATGRNLNTIRKIQQILDDV